MIMTDWDTHHQSLAFGLDVDGATFPKASVIVITTSWSNESGTMLVSVSLPLTLAAIALAASTSISPVMLLK